MRRLGSQLKALVSKMIPRRRSAETRAIDRDNRHRADVMRAQSNSANRGTFTSGGPGGVF